jgi:two-component system, OmpR family, alkaline phosphatase synthesis response regulator PhoP
MNGKKILVVDDDLAFCEMLTEILESEGASVSVEHDGQAGLEKALELHPDLILLDMMMPRMTGIAALELLRKDAWGKNVPAVLLTNVNQPEAMAASIEKGPPTEYLLKVDWTLDEIAEKIKKILAKV